MLKVKEVAAAIKLFPKLRLGEKQPKGGVKPTGPHTVKFLEEPVVVMVNKQGKMVKAFRFSVEEKGQAYRWIVPILNKENQPNYLVERLMDVEVGDERVLEMKKQGARNYIDVRKVGEEEIEEHEDEEEQEVEEDSLINGLTEIAQESLTLKATEK